jgi:mono/diheme cytochrome c family protein
MPFARRNAFLRTLIAAFVLALIAAGFVWSGVYNIGADDHHTAFVRDVIDTLRDRSIAVRAGDLQPPNLDDPQRVLQGAGHYAAMCTGCHLAPGMNDSEIRPGLYPLPPNLSKRGVDPKIAFWTIKHGIKMSAMPAWGTSHDDAEIWSIVAFVRRLPTITAAQYKDLVARAPRDEDMEAIPSMEMPAHSDEAHGDEAPPAEHR